LLLTCYFATFLRPPQAPTIEALMDLSLSEEQQLLKDSVARYVRDNYSVELRRQLRDTQAGFSPHTWQQFAELGWLALPFAEADGGFGGSALDVMVVMEELGKALVVEPYLVNIALCGAFLAAADEAQRQRFIPALIAGDSQWAFAFAEASSRYNLADISLRAESENDGYRLHGEKIAVLNGHLANFLVVSVRTAGEECDSQGISLMLVDCQSEGISRREYPLVDGSRGADIQFDGVLVGAENLLGDAGQALPLIERVVAQAIVAMGAEAVGAVDALLEMTVEYTKTREQFGQPIGKFQALQHRMADMYLHCQSLRSILYYAAIAHAEGREDAIKAASALKVKLGEAGRFVSQQAVQLHGGMGMTDELGVGHYLKRLLLLNTLFGDSEHHLRRYTRL
jgi:alkylation response protein AidB-like acyl-CoA dehydrogenase